MSRKLEINNAAELIAAFSDSKKLYGYKPAGEYDANNFIYPVVAIVNEEEKTFVIEEVKVKEEPKVEASPEPKTEVATAPVASSNNDSAAKKKKIGMIVGFTVLGVAVVIGIILAIYFGVK